MVRRGRVEGVCAGVAHLKATINLLKAAFNSCACSVSPSLSLSFSHCSKSVCTCFAVYLFLIFYFFCDYSGFVFGSIIPVVELQIAATVGERVAQSF